MSYIKIFFSMAVLFFLAGNSFSQSTNYFNPEYSAGFSYNFDAESADFSYQNIDFGYNIQNHEIGISVGQNEEFWYGVYYKYHLPYQFSIGYKLGKITESYPRDIYNELSIGKDLSITNDFSLRTNVFFSSTSENPLFLKNADSKLGFAVGMMYVF
jgi:hypothetical protein